MQEISSISRQQWLISKPSLLRIATYGNRRRKSTNRWSIQGWLSVAFTKPSPIRSSDRTCLALKTSCELLKKKWRRGQESNLHRLAPGGFQDRCNTIMRPLRSENALRNYSVQAAVGSTNT